MSERPEWMPETGTVTLLHLASDGLRETLFRETGLRAQVAKLEEMIEGQTGHWVDRIKAEIERLWKEIG